MLRLRGKKHADTAEGTCWSALMEELPQVSETDARARGAQCYGSEEEARRHCGGKTCWVCVDGRVAQVSETDARARGVGVTDPRKKHAGIVAEKLAGFALMEKLPKSPRRMRAREECSVTAPSKKHAGTVERSRRTVGAASTDRLCRLARPIAKPEAAAATVLEKRRSGIVVAEDQHLRRRRGPDILRPNILRARTSPIRTAQGHEAQKPTHVLPQRQHGDKIYA